MKILILGSNSFSARYFIDLCKKKKDKTLCISRSPQYDKIFLLNKKNKENFLRADLNKNFSKIKKEILNFNPEYIVNYAAQGEVRNSWKFPEDWYQTNFLSSSRLIEFLSEYKKLKKFINISTPEVYGSSKKLIKENNYYDPSTPYALSKLCLDLNLNVLHKKYNLPFIITRSSNVYGPGQQLYRIIPKTIILLKLGKKIELHNRGKTLRDFIHVSDVANFTYNCMVKGKIGETYHCSTNKKPLQISLIVKKICKMMDKNFRSSVIYKDENFGQDYCYNLDSTRSMSVLKWRPTKELEKGIRETIDWIDDNWKVIKNLNLDYEHKK